MVDVAVVSVVATALVAIAGVLVPALLRRGDRRHELLLLHETKHVEWRAEWWKRRESAYIETLQEAEKLYAALDAVRARAKSSESDAALLRMLEGVLEYEPPYNVDAYGSDEIAREWRGLFDISKSQLREAAQSLRIVVSQTDTRDDESIQKWAASERKRVGGIITRAADAVENQRYLLPAKIRAELAGGPEGAATANPQ
jgi:hypothetical protein